MPPTIKSVTIIALLMTALLLCACGKPPQLNPLPSDAIILAFGDSLTYGSGATPQQSYPQQLAQLLSRRVINAGVPGEISAAGIARLPALLDEYRPQLLILIHGGNDMIHKIPRSVTAHNLQQMVAAAKVRHIQVVLLGVPRPGLFLLESAEFYAQTAEQERLAADLEILPEVLADNALKADIVHPNAAGYRKIAAAVAKLLHETGAL